MTAGLKTTPTFRTKLKVFRRAALQSASRSAQFPQTGEGRGLSPGPFSCPYSPKCLEEEFSEVRIAVGHSRANLRVRLQPPPRGRVGRERDPARQPCLVRCALRELPPRAWVVLAPRTVADGLPAGLCRVGGDCRDRLSAGVRVHLIGCSPSESSVPASRASSHMEWHARCSRRRSLGGHRQT